jgi:Flp pilus assembly pilin Flp
MKNFFTFAQNETGLELSEYAVAAALIAIAVVLVFTQLGGSIVAALNLLTSILS